ncbi:MAG: DUF393 domain-containing protein [Cryomorphaceae bacterium]|nr:DUF393 domain-containing protein [Cryomorphaceae bacterium]
MIKNQNNIIFFDGVCNLCNNTVDFIIRRMGNRSFLFAPLQGESAKKLNIVSSEVEPGSIVYVADGRQFKQSTAVLKILVRLGGAWRLMAVFFIIPPFLRNLIYRFVAKNRYRWFGKKESCRMPTPDERAFFLP